MNNEMCGCGTEEKTSTAKGIVRINYKEDFELVVELLAGDNPYTLGDEDFRIDFIVMASRYTVGRTAGVCERCSVVDGNKIRCFMDAHGLPPGELRAEVKVNTPDPNYADGSRLSVAIAEGTVVLVKDNTRFDGAVIKANIPVTLVDAYQLAKAHGYKGTIDEYYSTFSDVSALLESVRGMAEEERKRSTAETERAKEEKQRNDTEVSRNENEKRRQTNENARKKAEQQRQTNEDARQKAEKERATAEGKRANIDKERDELVSRMQAAWQEIERMKKLREGEYGKEIELVEKIKNADKIPTQNVWLDATDGQIKSTPASEGINTNAYKYYYIGRREVVGNGGRFTNKYLHSLDLSNWDTQSLSDASYMFKGCSSLQSIDVSNWNTQVLKDGFAMFSGCSALQTIDVSNWDTQSLSSTNYMFENCTSLHSIDVSKWDTKALANAANMFENCFSLQSIDVSKWDTKALSNAYVMFSKCTALQSLDLSNWNTKALTSMRGMFSGCKALRLVDFRKANFSHVKDVFLLFSGCDALVELWLPMTFDLLTNIDLSIQSWGATPEGLASLRWTFGEGADDRTAKGLQPCTVKLHANVYDRLTDNERAAAAKKGWTITK